MLPALLFLSGRSVVAWSSDVTIVRRGVVSYFAAVSLSFGNSRRARRKVETTLVVMVDSLSSETSNFRVLIPAFSNSTSRRGNAFAREANSLTLVYDDRSSFQTSITPALLVESSIDFFASSPFETVRQAMMTLAALSRTACRAASRPKPVLLPVMITVCPSKEPSGTGIDTVYCDLSRSTTKTMMK